MAEQMISLDRELITYSFLFPTHFDDDGSIISLRFIETLLSFLLLINQESSEKMLIEARLNLQRSHSLLADFDR